MKDSTLTNSQPSVVMKYLCLINGIMTTHIDQNNFPFGNYHFKCYPITQVN